MLFQSNILTMNDVSVIGVFMVSLAHSDSAISICCKLPNDEVASRSIVIYLIRFLE